MFRLIFSEKSKKKNRSLSATNFAWRFKEFHISYKFALYSLYTAYNMFHYRMVSTFLLASTWYSQQSVSDYYWDCRILYTILFIDRLKNVVANQKYIDYIEE